MSAAASTIFSAIDSQAASVLGAGYTRMKRIFEPTENDLASLKNSYGVKYGEATSADGVVRSYTLDQKFEVMLATTAVSRSDDQAVQTALSGLYDLADDLLTQFMGTKLGLPALVLLIDSPAIAEPRPFPNGSVLLTISFTVKYRRPI